MRKTPHIAFIAPRFAGSGTVGGAETLLKQQASFLSANGWDVTFLATCATDHFTWQNALEPGMKEHEGMRVGFFPVDPRDSAMFRRIETQIALNTNLTEDEELNWIKNSVNSSELYEYLSANADQFDRIVIGPYLYGITYFSSLVAPEKTILVPCLHDEAFAHLNIIGKLFKSVAGCMFNTEQERNLAASLYGPRMLQFPCVGVGIESFEANSSRFRQKYNLKRPYIIYSGRREQLKGTPVLIDYFNTFRERTGQNLDLVLTGRGDVPIARSISNHVFDIGFVSEEDKHDAMAGATAFCHPSVNESLGIVLLETWLAQTPAIVHSHSNVLKGQCKKSGAGMWFEIYPEFEEELNLLINNKHIAQQMGARGKYYVEKYYSWKAIGPKLKSALNAPPSY